MTRSLWLFNLLLALLAIVLLATLADSIFRHEPTPANLAGGYLDPLLGGGVNEVAPFIALVAILAVKPYGLFGKVKIERV